MKLLMSLMLTIILSSVGLSQSTAFTYQGKLQTGVVSANGNFDFQFKLFDELSGGNQVGEVLSLNSVHVLNGIFSVNLDFGGAFVDGSARFLEISIRQTGGGSFETLDPRQQIVSTPHAVRSLVSSTAEVADSADQLGGVPANQYLQATGSGSGLSDLNASSISSGTLSNARLGQIPSANIADGAVTAAKIPAAQVVKSVNGLQDNVTLTAGSNVTITPSGNTLTISSSTPAFNGILNQTTQQAGADFNVSGAGKASTLDANEYLLSGARFISSPFGQNTYVGELAGSQHTTGTNNSFFGYRAGRVNTSGIANSFFGDGAGQSNIIGDNNSFFGFSSGFGSTGDNNSFIGRSAGTGNANGSNNTAIGHFTVFSNNLTNSTALGNRAQVNASNSIVLGSILGINGATSTVNVGIGLTAPTHRLHVVGNTRIDGSAFVDGDLGLGTTSPSQRLHVAGSAFVTSNVGIGTAPSAARLHVNGPILVTGPRNFTPTGNAMTFSSDADAETIQSFNNRSLSINPAGNNVGVGTTAPTSKLDVAGTLRVGTLGAAGATSLCRNTAGQISTCSSSLRYKDNLEGFRSGMSIVSRLKPVSFNWVDGGMFDLGLGAEDVAAIEPLLVTYNEKGEIEGVKYDRIGVVLVNAVKEQQVEIEEQKKKIEQLEEQNRIQSEALKELKKLICEALQNGSGCQTEKGN